MSYTIEDIIEILNRDRFKYRISSSEKNILASLSKQFSENIGLTDRQMELCLKKIQFYSDRLKDKGIDVSMLLVNKTLRMPLREIDRSQWIKIGKGSEGDREVLIVKFDYSKDFSNFWSGIKDLLLGKIIERSNFKEVSLLESNILLLVSELKDRNFNIDQELNNIYEKIKFISENPKNFLPFIDVVNDKFYAKNSNKNLEKYLETVSTVSDIKWLMTAKACGIHYKSREALEKISNLSTDSSVKNILSSVESRFRFDTEKYSMSDIVNIVNNLSVWPILFVVDEDSNCLDTVKNIVSASAPYIGTNQITVFFRLSNGQLNHNEFNQFVKENHLNNYIGPETKLVVISKNRIPKPLMTADWHPKTAVVTSAHDYGKISSYLNDFETVFYYNKSLQMRHSRVKGARKIVEL